MICFVGLGNPGNDYANTKHNAGFWVVDELARRWKINFKPGKGEYLFAEDQGRYIIEIEKNNLDKVKEILSKSSVHYDELGIVTEKDIIIDNKSKVTIDELNESNKNWLIKYMSN